MDASCYVLNYLGITKQRSICERAFFYDLVGSTQDIAISLAETNSKLDRTLIVAKEQSGGRGREGKNWISPEGGIWLSLIIRPGMPLKEASFVSLIASLSVCEAICYETGLQTNVKWPNDIVINSKKVSGILTSVGAENGTVKYLIVGLGINSNLDRSSLHFVSTTIGDNYGVTSLRNEMCGIDIDCGKLVARILRVLDYYYGQMKHNRWLIINKWKEKCETINKRVVIVNKDGTRYEAHASDIDSDGSLIVELANGSLIRIADGQCTVRIMPT